MIDSIILAVGVLYLLKILFFRAGWRRGARPGSSDLRPLVSVIGAARTEEQNIDRCLASLAELRYPEEYLEILVIDDGSTDATPERIAAWAAHSPRIRPLKTGGVVGDLRGKANAVAQAIGQSRGEIILTTDADCAVPPGWIEEIVRQYTPETGCVCGITLLEHEGLFTGMQSLDWAYLLTIASAGVGWNFPLSAVGNNMSFRREAYDAVGGYEGIGFSVTEDFALFKAIGYRTQWKVRYPVRKESLVWSKPCPTWRDLYLQKKRWGKGGVAIHPLGYLIMSVGFLMSVGVLAAPFLAADLRLWPLLIGMKCAGDWFLLAGPLGRLEQKKLFRYFLPFEIYYIFYVTLLPFIVAFTGQVAWKGRKF